MVEEEVAFVKVQERVGGNYMITIPADIIGKLRPKKSEKIKVLYDPDKRRLIYQF
jgi:hypothetical protein